MQIQCTVPGSVPARRVRLRRIRTIPIALVLGLVPACAPPKAPSVPASAPAPAPASAAAVPVPPRVIDPFPGVRVRPDERTVELDAIVCLEWGWLEQIACAPGTREHEALVVVETPASHLHAALLMAGFEAGAPGRWRRAGERIEFVAPEGSPLEILVRGDDGTGAVREHPIRDWIRAHQDERRFPAEPWVFGGSRFVPDPDPALDTEIYEADLSGSLVGLVTFGDETVGFSRVLADEADVQAPEWVVDSEVIPPVGTPVTLVFRDWSGASASP